MPSWAARFFIEENGTVLARSARHAIPARPGRRSLACRTGRSAHIAGMATGAQFPAEHSDEGEFERQEDAFRDWVKADGSTRYAPTPDRYHLYISLACPWAHRTLIVRHLRK